MARIEIKSEDSLQKFADETTAKLDEMGERGKSLDDNIGAVKAALATLETKLQALASTKPYSGDGGKVNLPISKEEFQASGMKALYYTPSSAKVNQHDGTLERGDGPIDRWKAAGDDLLQITSHLSNAQGQKIDPRSTKFYREKYLPALEAVKSILKDAIDTSTSAPGAGDWIPNEYGRDVQLLLSQSLRLTNLITRVTLPRSPFNWPRENARVNFKVKAEEIVDVTGTRTTATAQMADIGSTNDIFDKVTYQAKVLAGVATITDEADEDAIVVITPFMRAKGVRDLARNIDDAILNGDATGAHMDSDVAAITADHRKMFYGLRMFGNAAATALGFAGSTAIDSLADYRTTVLKAQALMGESGGDQSDKAFVIGYNVFADLLSISEFATAYSIGQNASVITGGGNFGDSFKPMGILTVVSPFARETLNASGVYDGVTVDNAAPVLFNRQAWKLGEVAGLRVMDFNDSFFQLWGQRGIGFRWRGDLRAPAGPTAATQTHTISILATTYN